MKILLVIPALGTVYGGPSNVVSGLAQGLGEQGVSVDIVATNANGQTNLEIPLNTWIAEKNYRVRYFPYQDFNDYKVSLSLTSWLFRHVAEYDLVHTNAIFSYPVLPAYWACQLHRVPYVMTPHGMLEPWALSYKGWKKSFYYALIEKLALRKATAIQIISASEAKNIKALGIETPLVFVPNGIHAQEFQALPEPRLFYEKFPNTQNRSLLLFLGRIDPKKGLDLLATAFSEVHAQFSQTHLVIVGPDNIGFLPTVQNYFAKAGCLEAVTFTGMLTGPLKYAALAAAHLYVSPSYSEGFSLSILEGMASGLPCVITTGCNFPEAATAQAAHVTDIDSNAISDALLEYLKDPQKAQEMGVRARQFILEHYTWDHIAIRMLKIYTAIVNKHPLP